MDFVKSEPIKVRIYGQEYLVKKPTFALTRDFTRKMKDKKEDEIYEVMCDYLNGLGIPKEVVEGMEADHVVGLFEYLTPKKS
jgi:Glu-tRNA(Gln) amidotransferase subunit E-like FAD-binding protein